MSCSFAAVLARSRYTHPRFAFQEPGTKSLESDKSIVPPPPATNLVVSFGRLALNRQIRRLLRYAPSGLGVMAGNGEPLIIRAGATLAPVISTSCT